MEKLHFAEQIKSALVSRNGKIGQILQLAILHEQGRWQDMNWDFLRDHQLAESDLNAIYTTALSWAERTLEAA